jgi:hypothetical protein
MLLKEMPAPVVWSRLKGVGERLLTYLNYDSERRGNPCGKNPELIIRPLE